MEGFAGYRTATANVLPAARAVMDSFHVVGLAAEKVTVCRHRTPAGIGAAPVIRCWGSAGSC